MTQGNKETHKSALSSSFKYNNLNLEYAIKDSCKININNYHKKIDLSHF